MKLGELVQSRAADACAPYFDTMPTMDELARSYVALALEAAGGNKSKVAERLGIDRRTLYRWIEKWSAEEVRPLEVSTLEGVGASGEREAPRFVASVELGRVAGAGSTRSSEAP